MIRIFPHPDDFLHELISAAGIFEWGGPKGFYTGKSVVTKLRLNLRQQKWLSADVREMMYCKCKEISSMAYIIIWFRCKILWDHLSRIHPDIRIWKETNEPNSNVWKILILWMLYLAAAATCGASKILAVFPPQMYVSPSSNIHDKQVGIQRV